MLDCRAIFFIKDNICFFTLCAHRSYQRLRHIDANDIKRLRFIKIAVINAPYIQHFLCQCYLTLETLVFIPFLVSIVNIFDNIDRSNAQFRISLDALAFGRAFHFHFELIVLDRRIQFAGQERHVANGIHHLLTVNLTFVLFNFLALGINIRYIAPIFLPLLRHDMFKRVIVFQFLKIIFFRIEAALEFNPEKN